MAALLGENKGKTLSLSALAAAASDRVWQCCPLSWQPGLAVASLQGWLNHVGWLCRWPKGALCLGCGGSSRKGRCVPGGREAALLRLLLSVSVLFQSLLAGYPGPSSTPAAPQAPKTAPPQPVSKAGQRKAAVPAANSLAKVPVRAAPADSDSSDSETDVEQVSANHRAGGSLGRARNLLGLGAKLCWHGRVTLGQGPAPIAALLQSAAWSAAAVCWLSLATALSSPPQAPLLRWLHRESVLCAPAALCPCLFQALL